MYQVSVVTDVAAFFFFFFTFSCPFRGSKYSNIRGLSQTLFWKAFGKLYQDQRGPRLFFLSIHKRSIPVGGCSRFCAVETCCYL